MNALTADGFDDAILGMAEGRVVYDRSKMIDILCKDMSQEDAEEYFDFNIAGAYMGEGTPLYLEKMTKEEIDEN